ncbi:GntR family transcriptional regulator [Streptomyces sp. NPDC001941]|uniref:GntR family transcriptional regulator n=1 Tax=Streptomyces sp. NPDC001941 TaxID=3154659 RepID=UPI00331EAD62
MAEAKRTRAATVYEAVREEIFQGALGPGRKLRLVELAGRFGVSQSVVREALTRLSEQDLVVAAPQQGFRVVTLSRAHLDELTDARVEVESLVLRRSVLRGDIRWEAAVVAAHHQLAGTPVVDAEGKPNDAWFAVHERFHQALLEGCGNERLLSVAMALRDAATLYRRWSIPIARDVARDVTAEHRALMDAALARDPDRAAELLAAHLDRTAQALRAVVDETAGTVA